MASRLRWLLASALVGIGLLAVCSRTLPGKLAHGIGTSDSVSLSRARALVERLAEKPHPVGSHEQAHIRTLIMDELRRTSIAVNEQSADAAINMAGSNQAARLHNVFATIPGRDPNSSAVMLVAHYDTAPNSRGAGDDGAAVASLLETARVISTGPRLKRTVHFLFTDGEEQGLLGAQAFVSANPMAQQIGLVINFEARGTSGPVMMYQSSPRSGALVAEYGKVVPFPHANSLISQLSRVLPNDSDASVFISSGFPVLAFAFVEGLENYHRYTDSSANLDPRTLAHCTAQALALARHFGDLRELPLATTDAVYFDWFSRCLVHYPCWGATLLGTLCVVGWFMLVRRDIRARRCTARTVLRGAKLQLLVIGLACVIPVMLHLLRSLMLDETELVRNSAGYGFADLLVVAALNLVFHARAYRRGSGRALALGSLAVVVTLGAILGWIVPQASAPWQWVSACALVVAWFEPAISSRNQKLAIVCQQMPLAVAVALLVPVVSTALASAGPALMLVPLVLAASIMEFAFATLFPQGGRLATAAAVVGCAGFLLMPSIALGSSKRAAIVSSASLVYAYNDRTNQALYAAPVAPYAAWVGQWVPAQAEQAPLEEFTPSQAHWRQVRAPIYPQPAPEISVTELKATEPTRQVELRVSQAASVECVTLWQPEGQPVKALSLNSQPIVQFVRFSPQFDALGLQLLTGNRERQVWKLSYCGLAEAPLVLRLQVRQTAPVRLRVVSEARSLPALMTRPKRPRPLNLVPGVVSDVTWVAQQVVF